jgi:hypothetical protein
MRLRLQPDGAFEVSAETVEEILAVFRGVRQDRRDNDIPQRVMQAMQEGKEICIVSGSVGKAELLVNAVAHIFGQLLEERESGTQSEPVAQSGQSDFRYFRDADGFRWKANETGVFLMSPRGEEWSEAHSLTVGHLTRPEKMKNSGRIETDAEGNPLAVDSAAAGPGF